MFWCHHPPQNSSIALVRWTSCSVLTFVFTLSHWLNSVAYHRQRAFLLRSSEFFASAHINLGLAQLKTGKPQVSVAEHQLETGRRHLEAA